MIEDPPLLTIKRRIDRPAADLVAKLKGCMTGHAIDAMEGRGALDARIKPVNPALSAFCGVALTCDSGPSDNLAILAALSIAEPGDVIVSANDGFRATAVIGDNVTLIAKNRGCAALVTDGMARDAAGIIEAGLPVFASGVTPNSCVASGPGRVGFAIVVGGVSVESGDVVIGDGDGVVVIPQSGLETVIRRLDDIRRAEAALQAQIRSGLSEFEHIGKLLKSARIRWLD